MLYHCSMTNLQHGKVNENMLPCKLRRWKDGGVLAAGRLTKLTRANAKQILHLWGISKRQYLLSPSLPPLSVGTTTFWQNRNNPRKYEFQQSDAMFSGDATV